MFLCDRCHNSKCDLHFSGSYGPCEICGYTAMCVDCDDVKRKRKKKKSLKKKGKNK